MGSPTHDRNLLFGILAVQMDFITRDSLVTAMNAWVLDKDKSLGEILVSQKALAVDRRMLLEALVQEHLKQHGNDAEKSLAAVSSIGSVEEDLRKIADPGVQASLVHLAARPPIDPHATRPLSVGATRVSSAGAAGEVSVGASTSLGTRFRILRPHARGGLGQVSVARDIELQREVALKEIQDRHADEPDSRARFLLEAEITGGLEHPGIVPVYGLGQYADGRPYYAMRFIRGDSLQEAVTRFYAGGDKRLDSSERAVELRALLGRFIDVCNAIAYAHSRGVLHRDLKPGNIMLGQYGETLVVDWGLAKPQDPEDVKSESVEGPIRLSSIGNSSATLMGSAIGTPQYMSPEQAAGRLDLLGPASDVYSLGATLYCVLTGRAPMQGPNVEAILQNVQRGEFQHPRAVNPEIPRPLEAICLKGMALKPADRYPSPKDLAGDVERWLADEPVSAYPEGLGAKTARWARKHKTLVASSIGLIIVVAIALAVTTILVKKQQILTEAARQEAQENFVKAEEARKQAAAARDQAKERYRMALDSYNAMVFGFQNKLKVRPDTEDLRKDFLGSARKGLERLLKEAERQGNPDKSLVWTYFGMGDIDSMLGKTQDAKSEYTTGEELAARLADADANNSAAQSDRGIGLIKLGNIAQTMKQTQEALDYYRKALVIRKQRVAAEPKDLKALHGLAKDYEVLGDVSLYSGQTQEALDYYRKLFGIRKQLTGADAEDPAAQFGLSVAIEKLGDVTMQLGQPKDALDYYDQEKSIRARLASADPKNVQLQRDLMVPYVKLGDVSKRMEQMKEAADYYRKALEICERLATDDPKNALLQYDLSVNYERMGEVSPPSEAIVFYQSEKTIRTRLVAADPKNASFQRYLTMSLIKLGEAMLAAGRKLESLDFFQNSLAIRERLADAAPKDTQAQRDLAYNIEKLGDANRQLDRSKDSLDFYQRALGVYERLADADTKNVGAKNDVAEGCYHVACGLARRSAGEDKEARDRDSQAAVSLLQQAVAKGFKDLKRLKEDKDLQPLRDREDFKTLVSGLEKAKDKK
jgi:eukaryotic-like serine/threonine-protein kinase